MKFIILLLSVTTVILARPNKNQHQSTCGYDSCHPTKKGILNVHIVPHTHDDVGWLKTVDQYYYGSNSKYQSAGVQYILDTVVDELMKSPDRRFVYVETAFFEKWWSKQTDQRRHHVKRLVNEGRLEFVGGAWSMNDEAAAHYQSVIDQTTWGLRWLNDTFGKCGRPRAIWQIDPFGHSREFASLWAQSGYDGLLLGRIDYQDKKRRMIEKEPEMIWRGSDDLGETSDIFTGVLYNRYSPPPGFCFDILCNDDPIIDNINSPDYNVDKMVNKFVEYANNQSKSYKSNHIIMTMGEDFTYQNSLMWFKNLDKLIKYVNMNNSDINLFYSTPSCYIKALNEAQIKWPTKQDDFFPYASDEHAYWTGYFSSRPTSKYFERRGNNFLQVCKQLYAMTNLNEKDKVDLNMLRTAMGVMQHHDAITGTEKQHVAQDYARMLELGIQDCLITTTEALNLLMSKPKLNKNSHFSKQLKDNTNAYIPMTLCQLNITECEITETSKRFVVTVYNPLAHVLNDYIRLPIVGNKYTVKDNTGGLVKMQISPIPESLIKQMPQRTSKATGELLFFAENLPPLGYRSYYIENIGAREPKSITSYVKRDTLVQQIIDSDPDKLLELRKNAKNMENSIGNDCIKINIDSGTGLISTLTIFENGDNYTIPFTQQLMYYEAMALFPNKTYNRPSGAYILRTNGTNAKAFEGKPINKIVKGSLVEELHQQFSDWASQIVRIHQQKKHIEFEWLIGPIPIDDNIGKEVISRFTTNIKNNGEFYTDSNGRQMIKRILNKRPTWKWDNTEPIAGNYYPVTSMISIKDNTNELFVLNDRAQGGSSLNDGQVELMIHRRLLYDDSFGVGEALNETENGIGLVARGSHYMFIGNSEKRVVPLAVTARHLALQKLLQRTIFVTSANNLTFNQWNENRNEFSGIHMEIPANVHLLTLEPWKDGKILLRLEHFLEKSDDPSNLSKPAIVNLRIMFSGIKIVSMNETTLTANQWKKDSSTLKWKTANEMLNNFNEAYQNSNEYFATQHIKLSPNKNNIQDDDFLVTLNPMEIKTFIIKAEFK